LGLGVWGLVFGFWGLGPTPQSPIPNPQSPIPINNIILSLKYLFNNYLKLIHLFKSFIPKKLNLNKI
jgi:hypothetical protein